MNENFPAINFPRKIAVHFIINQRVVKMAIS